MSVVYTCALLGGEVCNHEDAKLAPDMPLVTGEVVPYLTQEELDAEFEAASGSCDCPECWVDL